MYKICKTEKSLERQRQFQDTLLSMLKKQRFEDITVTSLCKEMDAPRKAFYRYFDTIYDVIYMIMDIILQDSFLFLTGKAEPVRFFEYWQKQKPFLDILERNGMSAMLTNRAFNLCVSSPLVMSSGEDDMKHACQITGLMTMLIIWHHSGMKRTPEEMTGLAYKVFR